VEREGGRGRGGKKETKKGQGKKRSSKNSINYKALLAETLPSSVRLSQLRFKRISSSNATGNAGDVKYCRQELPTISIKKIYIK